MARLMYRTSCICGPPCWEDPLNEQVTEERCTEVQPGKQIVETLLNGEINKSKHFVLMETIFYTKEGKATEQGMLAH